MINPLIQSMTKDAEEAGRLRAVVEVLSAEMRRCADSDWDYSAAEIRLRLDATLEAVDGLDPGKAQERRRAKAAEQRRLIDEAMHSPTLHELAAAKTEKTEGKSND